MADEQWDLISAMKVGVIRHGSEEEEEEENNEWYK